jgi:hypothetical protein
LFARHRCALSLNPYQQEHAMNLNEGKYRAKPVHASLGQSSTGKDQIEVVLAFYDGDVISHTERTAWLYLTPAAFNRSIAALRACGWTGDDLSDLSSISADTSPDVEAVLGEEEYHGQRKLKVKFINEWRDRAPQDPESAKSFASLMREKVRAADLANKTKTPPKSAPAADPFDS